MKLNKIRKALAAFVTPILGLPLVSWITGTEVWDAGKLVGAVLVGIGSAVAVYLAPNAA